MKKGDWDAALPLLSKAIPMLRREKLFVDLGKAHLLRSECDGVLSLMEECANDLVMAADVFAQGDELVGMCSALLELAHMSISRGDWQTAGSYAHRIVDQVLMSVTPVYNQALGIFAIAKAKAGDVEAASDLVARLSEVKGLSGIELAHKLQASALLATGVRQRNLAAKAVKEYLLRHREWMCKDLVPLM